MMASKKITTYDYCRDFDISMKWFFGVYDVSMKFPLDYSLHLRPRTFKSGTWKMDETSLIEFNLGRPTYDDEPQLALEFMQTVMNRTGYTQQWLYNQYVLRSSRKDEKVPDLIKFECGPYVWIVFNDHGPWPSILPKRMLDDKNYLTYNQKGSDVFVWDNRRMVRADY